MAGCPSVADRLGHRWVKTPRETAGGEIHAIEEVTPHRLATCARRARRLEFGGTTTVAGKAVMIIIERRGPGDAPTAVYVPLRGRPASAEDGHEPPAPSGPPPPGVLAHRAGVHQAGHHVLAVQR